MRQTCFIFLRAASRAERPSALRASCILLHTSPKGLGFEFHFWLALGKWPVTLGWSVVFMVIPLTSTFYNSLLSSDKAWFSLEWRKSNTLRPTPGVFKLSDNAEVTINAKYEHAPFRKTLLVRWMHVPVAKFLYAMGGIACFRQTSIVVLKMHNTHADIAWWPWTSYHA